MKSLSTRFLYSPRQSRGNPTSDDDNKTDKKEAAFSCWRFYRNFGSLSQGSILPLRHEEQINITGSENRCQNQISLFSTGQRFKGVKRLGYLPTPSLQ
ncbi:hypothetical protein TNCV_2389711 [Trichonephila clavipes]|nr:hypothetical protein TNCV_2389711 [Trichonephila clavipes]